MSTDRLSELTRRECLDFLSSAVIGRVVYTDAALPVCTPVTFVMHSSSIVFRTRAGSRVAGAVDDAIVAFEADEIDRIGRTGWSVLATGMATVVTDVATVLRLEQSGLVAWAGGERTCWIRIVPTIVTGRRVCGPGAGEALGAVGFRAGF